MSSEVAVDARKTASTTLWATWTTTVLPAWLSPSQLGGPAAQIHNGDQLLPAQREFAEHRSRRAGDCCNASRRKQQIIIDLSEALIRGRFISQDPEILWKF